MSTKVIIALVFLTGLGVSLAGVYLSTGLIWAGVFTMILAFAAAVTTRMEHTR